MENITFYLENISIITFLVVFIGGVATSFTPCVYPLIPVVIGVIGATKESSKTRNLMLSLSYVLGMALTFSVLGMIAALSGKFFGQIQSNPVAHLIVGNFMILFGLAMVGVIPLPVFLLNRVGVGKVTKRGNALSVFFMGVVSGFVAAPCTVAVLGALLAFVATTQNVVMGFSLLFVFAIGLGTLLVIVGTFTGILTAMSGANKKWMTVLEKVFAFGMILLGEYFIFRAGYLSI